MSWNIFVYILHLSQILRHCLHYIKNLPLNPLRNSPSADPMELPTVQPKSPLLHSSTPRQNELKQIGKQHPLHPTRRLWRKSTDLRINLPFEAPIRHAIKLNGNLRGPLLKQGMIVRHQNKRFYIREELGRWPEQQNQLTTIAVDLQANTTLIIFFPITLFDPENIRDETSPSSMVLPTPH